jgi:hypothetical protein
MSHLLMENRHGLIVDAALTAASTAERDAAITMLGRLDGRHRSTLGADKAYDVAAFIDRLRAIRVTPACGAEHRQPSLGDRRAHHLTPQLRRQPADPQAHRGGVRLDQDQRRTAENPPPRQGPRRLDLRPDRRRL